MPRSTNRRRAFSLVELIMAMTVSGILVGSMSVVLIMATSALERGQGPIAEERVAADALAELQADLSEATRFFERKPTSVWFEVPDRNGDGAAEHIRYAWSGVAGDPLTRRTNWGTPGNVATNVRALNLAYTLRAGPTQTTSTERLLAEFTAFAGSTTATGTVTATSLVAQVLRPSFAADVVSWKATKVRLRLKQSGAADATVRVSLVAVGSDGLPGSTVYATVDVKETLLSASLRIEEITFPTCSAIPAGQPVAILTQGISGTAAPCDIEHLVSATSIMPFNLWRATSANSGSSWTAYGQTQNLYFQLLGTATTEAR